MASRAEVRAEQQRLKDAGYYKGPVDGVEGGGTREARDAYRRAGEMAGASKAQADAQRADAEARAAEAKVKQIEAEGKAAKEKADAENAGVNRATQIAMNVGAAGLGVAAGHKIASRVENRHSVFMEQQVAAAKQVGNEARKTISRGVKAGKAGAGQIAKLQGIVTAADKLQVGKIKGPRGGIAAGVLLAEAAISRFVIAPNLENETAREAVNSVATLGVFGATTILSERAIANATPQVLPSGKDMAAIEAARSIVDGRPTVQPEAFKVPKLPKAPKALPPPSVGSQIASGAGKIAKGAAKYALPIVAGVAGLATFAKTGSAAEAGKAATDVVTSGGATFYDQARSAGMSKPRAVAEATVRGAYSMATFGIFDKKLTVPGSTQDRLEKVRGRVANFPRASANADRDAMFSHAVRGGISAGIANIALGEARAATTKLGRYGLRGVAVAAGINAAYHVGQILSPSASARGLSDAQKRDYAKATARHNAAASARAKTEKPVSDGMTDPYVRRQGGKNVQVGGYKTVLP